MVTQNMLRTCQEKQVFFERKNKICGYFRCKQMLWTDKTNAEKELSPSYILDVLEILSISVTESSYVKMDNIIPSNISIMEKTGKKLTAKKEFPSL